MEQLRRRPTGHLRHMTLAVTFLTGIPLPVRGEVSPADLWRSMGWYPLVGLALGTAAWGVYAGLLHFPQEVFIHGVDSAAHLKRDVVVPFDQPVEYRGCAAAFDRE